MDGNIHLNNVEDKLFYYGNKWQILVSIIVPRMAGPHQEHQHKMEVSQDTDGNLDLQDDTSFEYIHLQIKHCNIIYMNNVFSWAVIVVVT